MKTKEEIIKEAYNLHYNVIKNSLNDDGWLVDCHEEPIFSPSIGLIEEHEEHFWFRPKSLQGIENNRGWIKIESEEDLPNEQLYLYSSTTRIEWIGFLFNDYGYLVKGTATHYKPIVKPLPPLY